jgi:Leucine-rich repeat (LRR) protein
MDSFKINDYLTLKREHRRTKIYIKDKPFLQCKFLLLNLEKKDLNNYFEIDSIDEAAAKLDHSMEGNKSKRTKLPSRTEFWAHCSNLQAWAENKYDTRLLHSNLAFPLLKELTKAGDPLAKRVFKEEIAKRFMSGYIPVQHYLIQEGFIDYLSKDEIKTLIDVKKDLRKSEKGTRNLFDLAYLYEKINNIQKTIEVYEDILKLTPQNLDAIYNLARLYKKEGQYDKSTALLKDLLQLNHRYKPFWQFFNNVRESPFFLSILLKQLPLALKKPILDRLIQYNNKNPFESLTYLLKEELSKMDVKFVVFNRKIFKSFENNLVISKENVKNIKYIYNLEELSDLQSLSLHINKISKISALKYLKNLEELTLSFNKIERISGLENLKNLKKLDLKHNRIREISGLKGLKKIEYLNLPYNSIEKIEGLKELENLIQLILSFNQITLINNLDNLNKLEILDLSYNNISTVQNLENLSNLKELYLNGNPIENLKHLKSLQNLEKLGLDNTNVQKLPNFLLDLPNLQKISITNCPITYLPESFSTLIREDKHLPESLGMESIKYSKSDITEFNKLYSKPAIWDGKPTLDFRKWIIEKLKQNKK